jgi:hypothetical protein
MRTVYELMLRRGPGCGYDTVDTFDSRERAAGPTGVDLVRWSTSVHSDNLYVEHDGQEWLIASKRAADTDADRVELALEIALQYGQVDGDHHKAWVIDQIVRRLTGERYDEVIDDYREDGEYNWDEGIAP